MDIVPKFEVVTTASGEISIRNNVVNEIMHNPVGPWAEAHHLYIEASHLRQHLEQKSETPLIIYDVGLGAAANSLAAISTFESVIQAQGKCRPMTIVSFENDLSLLSFVIDQAAEIPYIGHKSLILRDLLEKRRWTGLDGLLQWILIEGNFLDTIQNSHLRPNIVFYDPYSPGVNGDMWTIEAFRKLYASTGWGEVPCTVYTYSRATPVRTAMLAAGFFVGSGPRSGLKNETTQAATNRRLLSDPLDQRWLVRWLRSHTRFPGICSDAEKRRITNDILSHPQFSNLYRSALGLEIDSEIHC